MRLYRPQGLHAGFHAQPADDVVLELTHAGEAWWPSHRLIREDQHPVWELYLQLDGASTWNVAGDSARRIGPDEAFAVAPRTRHGMPCRPESDHHFLFAGVDLEVVFARYPQWRSAWLEQPWVVLRAATSLREPFQALIDEVRRPGLPWRSEALRLAIARLVLAMTRLLQPVTPTVRPALLHPAVDKARSLMEADCRRTWRLHELAAEVGLSPTHLATRFERELGRPPRQYLLHLRAERARTLLNDREVPVARIAQVLGFSSHRHLAKVFRRCTGMTPGEWRKLGQ